MEYDYEALMPEFREAVAQLEVPGLDLDSFVSDILRAISKEAEEERLLDSQKDHIVHLFSTKCRAPNKEKLAKDFIESLVLTLPSRSYCKELMESFGSGRFSEADELKKEIQRAQAHLINSLDNPHSKFHHHVSRQLDMEVIEAMVPELTEVPQRFEILLHEYRNFEKVVPFRPKGLWENKKKKLLAQTPNGELLVYLGRKKKFLHFKNEKGLQSFSLFEFYSESWTNLKAPIEVSPNGSRFLAAFANSYYSDSANIGIIDLEKKKVAGKINTTDNKLIHWLNNEEIIYVLRNKEIVIHEIKENLKRQVKCQNLNNISSFAVAQNSKTVYAVTEEGQVIKAETMEMQEAAIWEVNLFEKLLLVEVSHNEEYLLVASSIKLFLLRTSDGATVGNFHTFKNIKWTPLKIRWSPDDQRIAVLTDTQVLIFERNIITNDHTVATSLHRTKFNTDFLVDMEVIWSQDTIFVVDEAGAGFTASN